MKMKKMMKINKETRETYLQIKNILRPRSMDSVTDWCCKNVMLSEPGRTVPFSVDNREFIREILDCFNNPKVHELTFISGAQTGKSTALLGGCSYTVANRPSRIFWVMATERSCKNFSDSRFKRMINRTPELSKLVVDPRRNLTTFMYYIGGSIIQFANPTPDGLSGSPARVVLLDESGKYPACTLREGDAVSLAKMRCASFSNRLIVIASTPTIEEGPEWQEYLKGDQRRYHLPCVHCGKLVTLAFSKTFSILPRLGNEAYIEWDKNAKTGGKWDYQRVKDSAHFVCPFCGGSITDRDKSRMMSKGVWIQTNKTNDESSRSYHISSLYACSSTSFNIGTLAVKFIKEKKAGLLQAFANGYLAEPWSSQSASKRREKIISSTMKHDGAWWKILTADYQLNAPHIWYIVRAWNKVGDSYLVDYGSCNTFDEYRAIQEKHEIPDLRVFIDSGFDTQHIYSECIKHGEIGENPNAGQIVNTRLEKNPAYLCFGWTPMKGFDQNKTWNDEVTGIPQIWGLGNAAVMNADIGLPLLQFNANAFKDFLERLRSGQAEQSWALTDIVTSRADVYFKHMDGEIRKVDKKGRTIVWERVSNKWPNHLFDAENMQLAAAASFGLLPTIKKEIYNG